MSATHFVLKKKIGDGGGVKEMPSCWEDMAFRLQALVFPCFQLDQRAVPDNTVSPKGGTGGGRTDVVTGVKKSPWGKLGGLPGGGKAEGQEPKEEMRCLLGHGMGVGRWVGET